MNHFSDDQPEDPFDRDEEERMRIIGDARIRLDPELQIRRVLEGLDSMLAGHELLTGNEVRRQKRMARPRESVVVEVADICRQACRFGAFSVDEMLEAQRQVLIARDHLDALDRIRARLEAKRLAAEGEVARRFSFFYRLAESMARLDETVRERFEAVAALTGRRKRLKQPKGR